MPPKRKSRIEHLRDKIYSPRVKSPNEKPRGRIFENNHEVSDSWPKAEPAPVRHKKKSLLGNTMFRKFFIGTIVFFFLSIGFGLLMFYGGRTTVSANNIDLNILGNAFVSGGEELPLKIELVNRNNVSLEFADLILQYQEGSGAGEELRSDRVTVGTIPAGGKIDKLVSLKLFGQQGTTRDVNITLEYRVKGSSAIFVKEKLYVVNISSTPVNLVVDGPEVTNTNQDLSWSVTTSLNTETAVAGMMLVVNYPPGFDFKSATPEPTFSNNIWDLGDLSKGAEKKITINGVLAADSGEERAFNIYTGTKDPEDEQRIGTQFNSENYIISIEKPFLDLALSVNGDNDAETTGYPGQTAQGTITIANNFDTKITDVEVTAKLSGTAFDPDEVDVAGGFYDPIRQEITWNSETSSFFASMDPGDRKEIAFGFKPIALSDSNIVNPYVDITLSVRGRQPSQGNQFAEIENLLKKKVKYGSSLQITGNALHNSGPIQNAGPLPPAPGTNTTYTIVWNVVNTSSRVTNVKVRATLPSYVDWTDEVSPANQSVTHNPSNREVLWNVGNIEPYVGLSSAPKQVYFQVRLNTSGSQSGTIPRILLDSVITGKDSFTGLDLSKSTGPVSTRLNLDSNYNAENDTVQ